jgi:hypothetical protein
MKMTNSRRASIIDARAHYWAAARRLRSTGLDYQSAKEGKFILTFDIFLNSINVIFSYIKVVLNI